MKNDIKVGGTSKHYKISISNSFAEFEKKEIVELKNYVQSTDPLVRLKNAVDLIKRAFGQVKLERNGIKKLIIVKSSRL